MTAPSSSLGLRKRGPKRIPENVPRYLRRVAMAGGVIVAVIAPRAAGLAIVALMLAPAVIVPLGLSLALAKTRIPPTKPVLFFARLLIVLAPIGGAAGAIGWIFPPGDSRAITAAALHGATCATTGLLGLARFAGRRSFTPLHEFAIDFGLMLLPVGGIWLLASRAHFVLLGFHEPVVTFTAAHFHYAGFAAPIVIGGAGRVLFREDETEGVKPPKRLYSVATIAVCAGIPATATGIMTTHTIEATSAVFLACGMLCASVVLVGFVSRRTYARSRAASVLFVLSGATLLLTMSLAMTFALTSSAGRGSTFTGLVGLQTMIDFHGAANALGFSLAGLVAHAMLASVEERRASS